MNTEPQPATPAAQQPAPQPTPQPTPKRRSGAVTIVTAVVGGLVLLGLGTSAAVAAVVSMNSGGSESSAVDVAGITSLDFEIGAASLTVEYAAVDQITLDTSGTRADDWTLRRDGDELVVKSPKSNSVGFCLFGACPGGRGQIAKATLILPTELRARALDASFKIGAGQLSATGEFGDLDIELGAGEATVTGAASSLDLTVDVGSFTGDLESVEEADIEVSVGEATVSLRGDAPKTVTLEASVGSINLFVPSGTYAVQAKSELGSVDNRLQNSASARNSIKATVTMGEITLRELK